MMQIRGLDHIAINCQDLNRSLEFYTNILGLRITAREYSKPGIEYFLDCGASLLGLIQAPEGAAHRLQEAGIGGNHVAFRVQTQDFDRIHEELKTQQVPITFSKKREKSWSLYFQDPDGNKLEIIAWPSEDASHGPPTA